MPFAATETPVTAGVTAKSQSVAVELPNVNNLSTVTVASEEDASAVTAAATADTVGAGGGVTPLGAR